MTGPATDADDILDIVGVGFGPSNLALAVAVREHNADRPAAEHLTQVYFEKQPAFGWHRGMLIDGATMQVSFIKDLVTMRNPASEYGFLSYLHDNDRLADFINHKSLFPSRVEFHDYLEWVARRFQDVARYGSEVVAMRPGPGGDHIEVIVRRGGEHRVQRARNVVVAVGQEPALPDDIELGDRIWHCAQLLERVERLTEEPRRAVVVGAGQSAAETTEFLHRRFENAEVSAIFLRYGYSVADDTPFANRIFDPESVDVFYGAPENVKRMLFDYHRNTNYSVVDQELADELYRRVYQERVRGVERLRILNASRLHAVRRDVTGDGLRVDVEHLPTGEKRSFGVDLVVYATGYRPIDPANVLGEVAEYCRRDAGKRPAITRDYRLETDDRLRAGIYLQGGTEQTHGISAQLLSNTAVRAGEIVRSIAGARVGAV
ncbi:lysine N(6)-hydroxylase/L-ornithine N(5)-oxygenase family protein [Actinomadura atramentaria]|uniref:lysine N(6)-hydroxylase/L-ornithine N(5)-oxygenase family protein n=1 Tax=Actinomadura atramentaria TaxID=1990 RepID=UPI000365FC4A|nr:SidA/IucD/PvdA family monooxygenase [Actinomadura atramentaria]